MAPIRHFLGHGLHGLVQLGKTAVVLWIGGTKPVQTMPPFYGGAEVIDSAIREKINRLGDKTELTWDEHEEYSQLKGLTK